MFYRIIIAALLCCVCVKTHGQTYYIDIKTGNDENSGLTPDQAWKTLRQVNITTFNSGDSILFHANQEWEGMLFPRGSGEEGNEIVISKYGKGKMPKIHGGNADPMYFEGIKTIQTVLLYNQQYWVISDLEITNMPDNIVKNFNDHCDEKRRGIFVVAADTGELRSITIKNNYIHHVKGDDTKDFHGSGGIMFSVLGKKKPSFFNGVYILNNRVSMVNRTGIGISSFWQRRPRNDVFPYSWIDEMGDYHANLNVVISGNDLKSIGGDGIVPQTTLKTLMEYNKVNGAASRSKGYNAGLWAWNSDSALIQFNEVCNTKTIRDGMAFDCDAYSVGNIYQYNFSHNNMGGFMLFHGYSEDVPDAMNLGHIIRFNISMNDGKSLFHFYGSGHSKSVIHHNLLFNNKNKVIPVTVNGKPLDVEITHNFFHIYKMEKWIGVDLIGEFIFFDNILLKKNRDIPEFNTIRKTKRSDLYQIFNRKTANHEKNDKTVNPVIIRQFWDNYSGFFRN